MVNYNIIDIPIDTALDNRSLSGGKTYLILLEAHPMANVKIRLNDNTADQIPLDTNYGIKFDKATQIYLSCNAVAGQSIKIGVSDTTSGNFEVLPSPTVDSINTVAEITELSGISTALNTALDNIVNPFQYDLTTRGSNNSTSYVNAFNKLMTCDKVKIVLTSNDFTIANNTNLIYRIKYNGVVIHSRKTYHSSNGIFDEYVLLDAKGKTLAIDSISVNSNDILHFEVSEFTKKT